MSKKNEKCFIGLPACGYISESAKACFIAYPSDERYKVKVDLIENVLKAKQYECFRAVRDAEPATMAFCTKICSKIIQSQFCIVLLDPSITKDGHCLPNPNVHFEYGMMLALNKVIVPLQDEGHDLAFNIAPLDTIKYQETNFTKKITDAIENAIKKFSKNDSEGIDNSTVPSEVGIYYNTNGYKVSDLSVPFIKLLYDHGMGLGYYLIEEKPNPKYKFVGVFPYEDPKKIVLHTKTLIDGLHSSYLRLMESEQGKKNPEGYSYLINDISIDLIVPSSYDKDEILRRVVSISEHHEHYKVRTLYLNDLQDYLAKQYNAIGEFKKNVR